MRQSGAQAHMNELQAKVKLAFLTTTMHFFEGCLPLMFIPGGKYL